MNWLCRMVGHKWITHRRIAADGLAIDQREVWGCCVRCGEPRPTELDWGGQETTDKPCIPSATDAPRFSTIQSSYDCAESFDCAWKADIGLHCASHCSTTEDVARVGFFAGWYRANSKETGNGKS